LLLPGGYHPIYKHSKSPSFDKNKLAETTAFLIKKAIKANRKGDFFPVYGICLGHELISFVLTHYSKSIITKVNGDVDVSRKL